METERVCERERKEKQRLREIGDETQSSPTVVIRFRYTKTVTSGTALKKITIKCIYQNFLLDSTACLFVRESMCERIESKCERIGERQKNKMSSV